MNHVMAVSWLLWFPTCVLLCLNLAEEEEALPQVPSFDTVHGLPEEDMMTPLILQQEPENIGNKRATYEQP